MSLTKVLFTVTEDEKLVNMISKFTCLYDVASPLYKNQIVKDIAWKETAEHVERSVEDCKKRWRNIRDTYSKRQKRGTGTTHSTSIKAKQWLLADMLSFLAKVDTNQQSTSNIHSDDTSNKEEILSAAETDEDTSSEQIETITTLPKSSEPIAEPNEESIQPPNKRQKLHEQIIQLVEDRRNERNEIIKGLIKNRDDDVDLFFKSIAISIKKLRPELINEAKMKTLQMLFDLENRNAT